ncbi:hypothetical protein FMUND_93 [Fusarium mundagurra]|uniref:Uncharacterized protein n=1 Tax=Fusarium mundagurra TaxID=1567541 RepID=A0A8H5Z9D2_9HYPO|nr:hypothetical protein FMUND_93 [Fusarium mundagurra]
MQGPAEDVTRRRQLLPLARVPRDQVLDCLSEPIPSTSILIWSTTSSLKRPCRRVMTRPRSVSWNRFWARLRCPLATDPSPSYLGFMKRGQERDDQEWHRKDDEHLDDENSWYRVQDIVKYMTTSVRMENTMAFVAGG